jgi:hypothetical protein
VYQALEVLRVLRGIGMAATVYLQSPRVIDRSPVRYKFILYKLCPTPVSKRADRPSLVLYLTSPKPELQADARCSVELSSDVRRHPSHRLAENRCTASDRDEPPVPRIRTPRWLAHNGEHSPFI